MTSIAGLSAFPPASAGVSRLVRGERTGHGRTVCRGRERPRLLRRHGQGLPEAVMRRCVVAARQSISSASGLPPSHGPGSQFGHRRPRDDGGADERRCAARFGWPGDDLWRRGLAAGRGVRADAGVGPSPWLADDTGRLAGVEHLAVATRVGRASRSIGKRSVNPDAGTDAPPLGNVAGGSAHEKPAAAGPGGGRCSSVFLGGTPYPLTGHPRGKGAGAGGGDERPGLKR